MIRPIHEIMMADIDYQIAEARKNAAFHNSKAATLEHLKELFEPDTRSRNANLECRN